MAEPAVHIAAIKALLGSGVTIVNIHTGRPDQQRVPDFYAAQVILRIERPI